MDSAILALTSASASCTRALDTARGHDTDTPPQLALILNDVDAHLARVYVSATRLALVLKPPSPTYQASIPLLDDLAQLPPALAHCTRLLRDDVHGATLAKDVRSRVTDIIDALRALLQTFLNGAARGPQRSTSSEEYLVRTATLHDLITDARGPSGIPKDNQAAVYRAWRSDKDSLDDGLKEIATLIKDTESDDPSDQADDGWDDIGLGHTAKMDEHELARANNIHQLLRLTTLFHKRILLDLLAHPSSAPVTVFDNLLLQSNRLLSTSDDLVAALYAPHDSAYIYAQMSELAKIVTSLQTQLAVFLSNDLANQLRALDVSSTSRKGDKKWFDTCVEHILRLCTRPDTK